REKGEWIHHLSVSADGRFIVMGDEGVGEISVWDSRTRRELKRLKCGNMVTFAEFGPKGSFLVVGAGKAEEKGTRASMQWWDVESGKLKKEIPLGGHGLAAAFSKNGDEILWLDQSAFRRWRISDGAELGAPLKIESGGRPQLAALSKDLKIAA